MMETEELFLTFACLLLFFDIIQLSKAKPRERRKLEYGFYASILACGLVVASYFMFFQAFLKDDFALKTVYSYSSSGLFTLYKVSATWAAMNGSMLFLTFLMVIAYFAYRFATYEEGGTFNITAYKVLDFILIFFLVITLMNSPFERLPSAPMDGAGLNPLLQTFWMTIHPPIVFVGYVFVILSFALVLASMNAKGEGKQRLLRLFLQSAWLFLTLGIAIGGLWSYEVLGWGGYWAWDPVETASLLPWLTLTAYFHLGPSSKRGESLARELIILITFSLVIFTTAITRGGLLESVHAFGVSPIGPMLVFLILCMVGYFFYQRRKISKSLYTLEVEKSSLFSISLFVGRWSLIFLTIVCFWGLAFPIIGGIFLKASMGTGAEFYNNWCFPFTLAFVAALIGCNLSDKLKLGKYAVLVFGAFGVGVALALVGRPTPNLLANLGLPLLVVALVVVGYKFARVLSKARRSFRLFGRTLLHLSIILILLGVFVSSTTKQVSGDILAKPNATIDVFGLKMEFKNFTVYNGTGNIHLRNRCYPEYSALKVDVAIEQGGNVHHGTLWIYLYTAYGVVIKPLIISTWTGDIYVHMQHTNSTYQALVRALLGAKVPPESFRLTVEVIPMVYLLWTGVALLAIGMAAPILRDAIKFTKKNDQSSRVV